MKQVTDLTGQVFGKLLVLDYAGRAENGKHRWRVRCECGTEKVVFASNLFSGKTRSCGCARHEEGPETEKAKGGESGSFVLRKVRAADRKRRDRL